MTDSILTSYRVQSTTTHIPFPTPVTPGLLDTYPSAAFAYSLRKLSNSYAGSAVRIRESGGNTEQNFGFVGSDFDAAGAATFIGGNSGFITTWYDQSGNGLDLTQATAANQPGYLATGLASKPTADFNNNQHLDRSVTNAVFGTGTQLTLMTIYNNNDNDSTIFAWRPDGALNEMLMCPSVAGFILMDFGTSGSRVNVSPPADLVNYIVEWYRDSSNTQAIVVNGTSFVSGTKTDALSAGTNFMSIGASNTANVFATWMTGQVSELVYWSTDLGTTNRAAARQNMNSYYLIF